MSEQNYKAIIKLLDTLDAEQLFDLIDVINKRLRNNSSLQSKRGKKIVIELTEGSINQGYIHLGDNVDFFPRDCMGQQNAKLGEGRKLMLHVAGYEDVLYTDIIPERRFCSRKWGIFSKNISLNKVIGLLLNKSIVMSTKCTLFESSLR